MSNISESKIHAIAKYWAQKLATIGIKKIDINEDGDIVITYGDDTTSILSGSIFMEKKNYDPTNSGKVLISQNSEKLNNQLPDYYATSSDLSTIKNSNVQDYANNSEIISTLSQVILNNHNLITKENVDKKVNDINTTIGTLTVETETNNNAIHNIIKGDYLSISNGNSIDLVKTTNGVTIDMVALTNQLEEINIKLDNLQLKDSQIIKGDYLSVDGGLSTTKTLNGVIVHGQDLTHYELKSNKNIPNGYAALDANGKTINSELPIATTTVNGVVKIGSGLNITTDGILSVSGGSSKGFTTYPLLENSTILDTITGTFFKQRCSSKNDLRYDQNTTTNLTKNIPSNAQTNVYITSFTSISDDGVWLGSYSGLVGISNLRQRAAQNGRWRISYYKRTLLGIETLVGRSSEINATTNSNMSDLTFLTSFNDFTFIVGDRLVARVEFSKTTNAEVSFTVYMGIEGATSTYSTFYVGGGGSTPTDIPISNIQNLTQIFEGNYSIADLKLSGQIYSLNDFMTIAQVNASANIIYVKDGGLNGNGSLFTPYGSINTAFSALSLARDMIEILDSNIYTLPIDTNGHMKSFIGTKCTTRGTLHLNKSDSFYHVKKHIGDIEVQGNNIMILIDENLQGDIYVTGTNTTFIVNKWDNSLFTIDGEANIADGSKIGRYIYGHIARR